MKVTVTEEMAQAVDVMVRHVSALCDGRVDLGPGYLKLSGNTLGAVELELSLVDFIPEGKGTADLALYRVDTEDAHIADYKHGAGVEVDVEWNPQLLIYLWAFVLVLRKRGHDPKRGVLHIVQPRAGLGVPKTWSLDMEELEAWVEDVLNPAVAAVLDPTAPLVVDEEACRWCRAKAVCPEHHQAMVEVVVGEPVVFPDLDALPIPAATTLTPEQLGRALPHLDAIEAWVEAVRGHALHLILTGHDVPGFKAVEGRKGHRKWRNEATTPDLLMDEFGLDETVIYDVQIASPAQIEKLIPKDRRPALAALTSQSEGKPTLAPTTDKRPALTVQFDVVED